MKKFILIFGIMIAAIGFTACNREPDFRMLENASPENPSGSESESQSEETSQDRDINFDL